MGGFVVQKYLESRDAPAAVLVASVPSRGGVGAALRRIKRYPWNTVRAALTGKSLRAVASTPQLCRESFFSASTPEPHVLKYHARLQEESARATWLDMMLEPGWAAVAERIHLWLGTRGL
jgi:hypothetical protein